MTIIIDGTTGVPVSPVTGTLAVLNGGTGTTSTTFVNLATNVTGTLPVANGGTGVTAASTGTGGVVLSASPTFTGTPLSTTAASATNTTQIATTAFAYGTLSAAANGYVVLPNGLYMQWGTSGSVSGDSSITVTYPIAFPSAIYNVQITAIGALLTTGQGEDRVSSVGLTTFSLNHGFDGTETFYWMAIGK